MNARRPNPYRPGPEPEYQPGDRTVRSQKLYRDTEHKIIAGVCAGLAEKHGMPRILVRLIAVLLLFTPLTLVVVIAYCIAAFVVPPKPRDLYGSPEEEVFWRSVNSAPSDTFGQLRHRFREIENRLRRMEAYVTSKEYQLDREIGRGRR